jgi:toxin ParE1/3/4
MMYKVRLTEQAKEDIRGIYEYVAYTLLEPGVAQTLKNRIIDGLKSLQQMPRRCPVYQDEPWKSRELRRIIIGNYFGFYLIADKTVQVIRIVYSGRDITNILSESD